MQEKMNMESILEYQKSCKDVKVLTLIEYFLSERLMRNSYKSLCKELQYKLDSITASSNAKIEELQAKLCGNESELDYYRRKKS